MKKFLSGFQKVITAGNNVCYAIASIAIVLMTLNVMAAAISTWIFGIAFPIPVDITGLLLLLGIAFAYPSFQYKNGFVRVDILTHGMKGRVKQVFELISLVFSLGFYILCVESGYSLFNNYLQTRQRLTSVSLVIWPFAFCLFIALTWAAIVTVYQIFDVSVNGVPATGDADGSVTTM